MFGKTLNRWLAVALIAAPAVAVALAAKIPDYTSRLGSPADGRLRPSTLPGIEEAYLTPVFPSSHAANLLTLRNGDLLCVWFSGTWEGESDVAIMMARLPKGSRQWSRPRVVDHRSGESFQNPVVFEAPDGVLWIVHTTQGAGQGQANANVLVTKSTDGGKIWTAPAVLFDTPGSFVRQPILVLPDGNWMLPMYVTPSRGITQGAESNYSVVKISADRGTHWKDCAVPKSNGYVQPDVVPIPGGRYLAFFRSRFADFIYQSTSQDGCTWTAPQKTQLPNNNSSIQVAKLANGHLVMAFNNVGSVVAAGKPQAGPRKPLTVALSEDGGATWKWVRDLEVGLPPAAAAEGRPNRKEPGREEYSYPSIAQTGDGSIYVAYTFRRFTIKTVRFNEAWIRNGTTAGTFTGDARK
jgi:predicted neuraminidase